MVNGVGDVQNIDGTKIFTNDVSIINGSLNLLHVNNVNVVDLERNVLKTSGDQNITGILHVSNILARV